MISTTPVSADQNGFLFEKARNEVIQASLDAIKEGDMGIFQHELTVLTPLSEREIDILVSSCLEEDSPEAFELILESCQGQQRAHLLFDLFNEAMELGYEFVARFMLSKGVASMAPKNRIDPLWMDHLRKAVIEVKPELLKQLLDALPVIYAQGLDEDGCSLLHHAVVRGNFEVVRVLLQPKYQIDHSLRVPMLNVTAKTLAYWLGYENLYQAMPDDGEAAKRIHEDLVHLFGQPGFPEFESSAFFAMTRLCKKVFTSACKELGFDMRYKERTATMIDLLKRTALVAKSRSSKKMLEDVASGKPWMWEAGWERHSIALLFYEVNGKWFLSICNRGERDNELDETLCTYPIDRAKITVEVIESILAQDTRDYKEGRQFCYKCLPELIAGSHVFNEPVYQALRMFQKPTNSKAGTCAAHNQETAMRLLWVILAASGAQDPKVAALEARCESKLIRFMEQALFLEEQLAHPLPIGERRIDLYLALEKSLRNRLSKMRSRWKEAEEWKPHLSLCKKSMQQVDLLMSKLIPPIDHLKRLVSRHNPLFSIYN